MRPEPNIHLDRYRVVHRTKGESPPGASYGCFAIGGLTVISSGGRSKFSEWEHVSVSTPTGCPRWGDMERVRELFWRSDETVVQFSPPRPNMVNTHRYCLHLWKPPYPVGLPPLSLV